jgi:hypothetical protein|eukprot:COSAG01_NODE_424_length_17253_cov_31.601900_25_plen_53_part_00
MFKIDYYSRLANSPNGMCFQGQVNVSQAEFERIALAQVQELWTNYGQLGEIW